MAVVKCFWLRAMRFNAFAKFLARLSSGLVNAVFITPSIFWSLDSLAIFEMSSAYGEAISVVTFEAVYAQSVREREFGALGKLGFVRSQPRAPRKLALLLVQFLAKLIWQELPRLLRAQFFVSLHPSSFLLFVTTPTAVGHPTDFTMAESAHVMRRSRTTGARESQTRAPKP